jgi:protein-tyrosine phosphatase
MLNLLRNQAIVPVIYSDQETVSPRQVWSLFRKTPQADLFFGGQYNSNGLKKLRSLGITAIVNMRSQVIHLDDAHQDFRYLHLPTLDGNPPDLEMLIKGADFIDEEIKNGGKVYINCLKAKGRGPTMAIAYLIKAGKSFDEAHEQLKKRCPDMMLNPFQESKLRELEEHYLRCNLLSS